jgi:hypothetical protein
VIKRRKTLPLLLKTGKSDKSRVLAYQELHARAGDAILTKLQIYEKQDNEAGQSGTGPHLMVKKSVATI